MRGGFKSPTLTTSKTIESIVTISYMCILKDVLRMFQISFFKNSQFCLFYSDFFKIESSENSCKNIISTVLSKMDF